MASVPGLKQKTAAADATGVASWSGTNGIEAQFTDVSDLLLERGVMVVETTTALGMVSAADARIVIVRAVGLYVYTQGSGSGALDVPASGGGRWQFQVSLSTASYSQVIGNSTAGTTSFTITHNLNSLHPTILIYEPASPGGSTGYVLRDIEELGVTITTVDANNTTVDFGATVPATAQYTVVAKP